MRFFTILLSVIICFAAITTRATAQTPTISSVSPAQPIATGATQPFTITGASFISTATVDLEDVTMNQQFYNRTVSSRTGSTGITINPNFGTETTNHAWRVRVNNGATPSAWFNFIVVPPTLTPTISSVSPAQPIATGATQPFTISGANFISTATVDLEDVTAGQQFYNRTVSSRSGTTGITINPNFGTAASSGESWRVRVNNGATPSAWFNFTVVPPTPTPSISSVSPAQPVATGAAQPFTIFGANFVSTATVDLEDLTLGQQFYNRTVSSRTGSTGISINPNFGTAASSGESWRVRVNNGATPSAWFNFTVVPPTPTPTISSVSPAQPIATGAAQSFTITGTNFISTAMVDLADLTTGEYFLNRSVSSRSGSTGITINPNFGTETTSHSWQVRVNNDSTPSTWFNFTVVPPTPTPTIASVSPAQPVATGAAEPFTITGANFISTATVDVADLTTGEYFPDRAVSNRSGSAAITINPNFGTETTSHSWQVRVNNDSTSSAWFNFTVVPSTQSTSRVVGIDVSSYQQQGTINWGQVAQAQSPFGGQSYPVTFAYIRASKGTADVNDCQFADPKFSARAAEAVSAGLTVGAYHVASVINPAGGTFSAVDEANFFVDRAALYIAARNMRPALDLEDHSCGHSRDIGYAALATWVDAWMQQVHSRTGVWPILYCSEPYKSGIGAYLAPQYDLWVADWASTGTPISSPWGTSTLWQYSASGNVTGVGSVDLDVFLGDMQSFQSALVISNGNQDTTPPTITLFNIAPPSVPVGSYFVASFGVSDSGGSGLNRVELWRANGDGSPSDSSWTQIQTISLSGGDSSAGLFVPDTASVVGTFWYGMHVVDGAGNLTDERAAGLGPVQVTVTAATNCKPNAVSATGCVDPTDLLGFLNLYFTNYDGAGSAVPGDNQTLPQVNPHSRIYAVPCSAAQQSTVPPVVTSQGLKADYDGDCQVGPNDLLGFLHDYFNPGAACFAGC